MSYASVKERQYAPVRSRRTICTAIGLLALATVLGVALEWTDTLLAVRASFISRPASTCSATAFDSGSWQRKAHPPTGLQTYADFLTASGYKGCRAQFETAWMFGINADHAAHPEQREPSMAYDWIPHPTCKMREPTMLQKLQALIDAPLLMTSDSRGRQHFFQLSCELFEHVRWEGPTPETVYGRVWRMGHQHLFLSRDSPLLSQLKLPRNFDFDQSILTYVQNYTPLSRQEMRALPGVNASIIPAEDSDPEYPAYEMSKHNTLDLFLGPDSHYKTLYFSTGSHFGPTLWRGIVSSVPDTIQLFRATVKDYLLTLQAGLRPGQKALIAGAPGHHWGCDQYTGGPMAEPGFYVWDMHWLPDLNVALRDETDFLADPRLTWIGTDRLSRIRPDAHLPNDGCVHFGMGTGVFEQMSRFMWVNMVS